MTTAKRLSREFYNRPTLKVTRDLLGKRLVRVENGVRIAGIITEVEAYCGEQDLGCHAKVGLTPRTEPMYGPPGMTFVYFTYGMHWMLCFVTCPEGEPEAVLVRAIMPTEGLEMIKARRGKQPRKLWTDGPGKLTMALGINKRHNNMDMINQDAAIFVEEALNIPNKYVTETPRIGLYSVPEPWKSIPWRFLATLPESWALEQLSGG